MNSNDYRIRAYQNASKTKSVGKEKPAEKIAITKKQNFVSDESIKAATDALTSGGLLKVPVEQNPNGGDSVYRRVAKFLILIGVDQAAQVLKHLSQEETEKLIPEISSIRSVSDDEASAIFAEFKALELRVKEKGGVETAHTILEKAFGKSRADEMIKNAVPLPTSKPFEYLKDSSKEKVYALLKDESVAIRALVLSNLEPKKAASVINLMPTDEKKDLVLRLAKMNPVSPEVLDRIDRTMHEKSLALVDEKTSSIDGKNILSEILKRMDVHSGQEILSAISDSDDELGQDLRSRMFTEEDILNADTRFLQEYLRTLSNTDLAYLIAVKSTAFRAKILENLSSTRGDVVLEEEQLRKPMLRSDCDKITNAFYSYLRRAYEDGKLVISNRSDDIYV